MINATKAYVNNKLSEMEEEEDLREQIRKKNDLNILIDYLNHIEDFLGKSYTAEVRNRLRQIDQKQDDEMNLKNWELMLEVDDEIKEDYSENPLQEKFLQR